jgi:hypothetical protein
LLRGVYVEIHEMACLSKRNSEFRQMIAPTAESAQEVSNER